MIEVHHQHDSHTNRKDEDKAKQKIKKCTIHPDSRKQHDELRSCVLLLINKAHNHDLRKISALCAKRYAVFHYRIHGFVYTIIPINANIVSLLT